MVTSRFAAALLCLWALPCRADVELLNVPGDVAAIHISNEIKRADVATFERLIQGRGQAIVFLDGPGGDARAGFAIGSTIRQHKFKTVALNECASSCAVIWLGGEQRFIDKNAKVGFHAAYNDNGVSAVGNALLGAYANDLHLGLDAVAYVVSAPPSGMRWLTAEDAKRIGITYDVLDLDEPAPAPAPAPKVVSMEQKAANRVASYQAAWSQPGSNVEAMRGFYTDTLNFYGTWVSAEKVMTEKRKFAARWPGRSYTLPEAVNVSCDHGICVVSGVVQWTVSSQERNAQAHGTAEFVVCIDPATGLIMAESGKTLTNKQEPLVSTSVASVLAAGTGTFDDGRQARVAYESWYTSLPEGGYKAGVTWYAAHRSDPSPPSCLHSHMSVDWVAGCLASNDRLKASDMRRKADTNYRAGWNSVS